MKFSEVVRALEDGKKMQREGSGVYYELTGPPGIKKHLIEVWQDGTWAHATLEFRDEKDGEGWSIIP
jgi:hypothetical protein